MVCCSLKADNGEYEYEVAKTAMECELRYEDVLQDSKGKEVY